MKNKNVKIMKEIIKDINSREIPILIGENKRLVKDTHKVYINDIADFLSVDLINNLKQTICFNIMYHKEYGVIEKETPTKDVILDKLKREAIEYLEYIDFDKFYGTDE